ncbi:dipicolinate synthase subunit B [Halobacillus karajensis]|uniref:Dipicolinate synthase subunit B n=1 Tax=Halobacillus karajensis TaxID=195088 RepID=A0A024P1H4_9BACI|nr:dipicolinate synthase subunit B [Halobacillus karajensis]CDQ19694.1 Dipicolinate synthase subunit B [Halobacillus karajensis]CDQ22154.1 Dipicolinate synthase subunit B [Halobacillus karajensis]CDQ27995.1 Dipicolinate synthase subunit B [Halobacillus karajensis]SEH73729.1 dipicolinate synthase subunit B [Halobacillus karajensis]
MMTKLKGKIIGFGLTGSHCTYHEVFPVMQELVDMGATVIPVLSYTVQKTDTRFGDAADHLKKIKEITGEEPIMTIPDAEPLGPKRPLDCMLIAPLTGNSTSKFANALTDSPVLMAAKATLRNENPVVLAVSTNDALGLNGVNIMRLMATKNIYFVPLGQDHPFKKPNSLVADMTLIPETIEAALDGKQRQPVLIERYPD